MNRVMKLTTGLVFLTTFASCDMASHIENRSQTINQNEDTILQLSKEKRMLTMKISSLKTKRRLDPFRI